jgi:hypothetical protein
MVGIAPDLSIRSYRQRPSDHILAGGGFGVLKDEYAHSSTQASDPASAGDRGLETVGAVDLGQQLADGNSVHD